ncbi:unnamed protein product [Soboliphyme baturini]|uniref:Uncharacterized protein n=1 Tax=Soboliphyme baturini TaxID=241478 RepID=A0A183J0X9_9BILA|nr:unnamed protein product [Soboliphyme baturini]
MPPADCRRLTSLDVCRRLCVSRVRRREAVKLFTKQLSCVNTYRAEVASLRPRASVPRTYKCRRLLGNTRRRKRRPKSPDPFRSPRWLASTGWLPSVDGRRYCCLNSLLDTL